MDSFSLLKLTKLKPPDPSEKRTAHCDMFGCCLVSCHICYNQLDGCAHPDRSFGSLVIFKGHPKQCPDCRELHGDALYGFFFGEKY